MTDLIATFLTDKITHEEAFNRINGVVVPDLETNNHLNPKNGFITDCGLTWIEDKKLFSCNFPWNEKTEKLLKDLNDKPGIYFGNQNIKFDERWLKEKHQIDLRKKTVFCTLLLEQMIDSNSKKSLDYLVEKWLPEISPEFLAWYRNMKALRIQMELMSKEEKDQYVHADTEFPIRIVNRQTKYLKENNPAGFKLFTDLEMPLMKVLIDVEITGVWIDRAYRDDCEQKLLARKEELEKEIFEYIPDDLKYIQKTKSSVVPFNINSDKQLRELFFNRLGLEPQGWTKGGKSGFNKQPSVDDMNMRRIYEKTPHPVIKNILEYVKIMDQTSKYLNIFKDPFLYEDGKARTNWYQCPDETTGKGGTKSGRLTAGGRDDEQPLQIITSNDKAHPLFLPRKLIYSPHEDYIIFAGDLKAIEMKVLSYLCQDEDLLNVFKNDIDIHKFNASKIYKIRIEDVTPHQRKLGKLMGFSIAFDCGWSSLIEQAFKNFDLIVSEEDAKKIVWGAKTVYKGIAKAKEKTIKEAQSQGFVDSVYGRRRYTPNINSTVFGIRANEERAAFNHQNSQSVASDFIKYIMLGISKECEWDKEDGAKIWGLCHDEISMYCRLDKIDEMIELFETVKEEVPPIGESPNSFYSFEYKVGYNYAEMYDIETFKERLKQRQKVLF